MWSQGGIEGQPHRVEAPGEVLHIERILLEVANLLAHVGTSGSAQSGVIVSPAATMTTWAALMSITFESMIALATRLAYSRLFSCSTGSPLSITGVRQR